MTEREILLKKISTYKFAIIDIQLFLDTHPDDKSMLNKLNEYKKTVTPLVREYETKFGPLKKSNEDNNTWLWVKNPWPWDTEDEK